jgi:hypothetical protein
MPTLLIVVVIVLVVLYLTLRGVNVLRTAAEPMTAREIAERVLAAANINKPDKAALDDLIGTGLASLRNHQGKGVQRANEGSIIVLRTVTCELSGGPRRS